MSDNFTDIETRRLNAQVGTPSMADMQAHAVRQHLLNLTADGPVILLPDEGDGVKVAKLNAVHDGVWLRLSQLDWDEMDMAPLIEESAREVAE